MSSREKVLQQVGLNKPAQVALPNQIVFDTLPPESRLPLFVKSFTGAGGVTAVVQNLTDLEIQLRQDFDITDSFINTFAEIPLGLSAGYAAETTGHIFAQLKVAVIKGTLGVAENGGIWVEESNIPFRVLPFICEHLVMVIAQSTLVGTMHEAYQNIKVADNGYGVFIAGPSRTADIEQSLVIGAHGPKRAHAYIIANA